MLPNWLYGKSKSKLAELLGGGGAPSDYNQVKAQVTQNTEDIASLDDTKAALTQISNPNLLDNPWFTVNQRGEASSYFADRWLRYALELTFTNNDGVTISGTPSSIENLGTQKIEWDRLKDNIGKAITLSVLIDGTVYKAVGKIETPTSSWRSHVNLEIPSLNIAFQLLTDGASPSIAELVLKIINTDAINVTIKAIKLELGSVSTLAMDTAPNYATELVKCQRYFQRLKSTSGDAVAAATGYATTTTAIRVENNYSGNMRKQPTASISSPSDFVYTQTNYASGSSPDEIAVFASFGNAISLNLTVSTGTYKQGDVYKIYASGNAYIDLSADL